MEVRSETHIGDCLDVMAQKPPETADLVYVDPPFFTQKTHRLTSKDGVRDFSFDDLWQDSNSYATFIRDRISLAHVLLKNTGSIFFHCDKSASHIVHTILDEIFGAENFQSEIIWYFKRWSNSKKGLLPNHQTIFFYSKSKDFKFNQSFDDYSPTTNIDQIMQKRARDDRNKSVYAKDNNGHVISSGAKRGVPLSDVWEIPFLNPKAKERVDYPTQKPITLMKKIIELVTDNGDTVLDPFCGSGSTLVAAKILNRNSIGIDKSSDAITLSRSRLENPIVSDSVLLNRGKQSYVQHDIDAKNYLTGIDYIPVHRNKGIDGLLKQEIDGLPTFIRVQRSCETLEQAIQVLKKSTKSKGHCKLLILATHMDAMAQKSQSKDVIILRSASIELENILSQQTQHFFKAV